MTKEDRITPAYAGKSSCHKKEARGNRDHPRLCGEKPASSSLVMFQPGSPPPMRGKDAAGAFRAAAPGITPAYAGKRHTQRKILPDTWDHPRLCGEKKDTRRRKWRQSGSPPPMRGKAQNGSKRRRVHRITPAYAGKSFDHSASFSSVRDHPRLCGEKFRIVVSTAFRSGSPPPMRGKVTPK